MVSQAGAGCVALKRPSPRSPCLKGTQIVGGTQDKHAADRLAVQGAEMPFIACEEVSRLGLDSREQDRAIFFRQEDAGWEVAVRAIRDQLDV